MFYYLCEITGFEALHHVSEALDEDVYIIRRSSESYFVEYSLSYSEELTNHKDWEVVLKEI